MLFVVVFVLLLRVNLYRDCMNSSFRFLVRLKHIMGALLFGKMRLLSGSDQICSGNAMHCLMLMRCSLGVLKVLKTVGAGFEFLNVFVNLVFRPSINAVRLMFLLIIASK